MSLRVADLVAAMEAVAPPRLALPWDNVGLLVGDAEAPLTGVLLAIDCTREVVDEARVAGRSAIVSYHPPIFKAQKAFVAPSVAFLAARAGVALYSPHTAFDVVDGGTNDVLADLVGMTERTALQVTDRPATEPGRLGIGRVGPVVPMPAHLVVDRIKRELGVARVLAVGSLERVVQRVAVCAGSAGDLVDHAAAAGADLLLAGELRHHDALRAAAAGVVVVCVLHSVSERVALGALERALSPRLPGVPVAASLVDRDPFTFV